MIGKASSRPLRGFVSMVCSLWMAGVVVAASQSLTQAASQVHDETMLFTEAQSADLAAELAAAEHLTRVSVFVTALTFSSDATARDTAARLSQSLAGGKPGLVLLFDRGKQSAAIAASSALWQRYPVDEVTALLAKAGEVLAKTATKPEERMQSAAALVLRQLGRMEAARLTRHQPFNRADARLAKVVAVMLVMFLLTAAGIARWSAQCRLSRVEKIQFPDVEVATRLGAPFGGGVVVSSEDWDVGRGT